MKKIMELKGTSLFCKEVGKERSSFLSLSSRYTIHYDIETNMHLFIFFMLKNPISIKIDF